MSLKLIKIRKGETQLPLNKLNDLKDYSGLELIGGSMEELPDILEYTKHLKVLIINCPELKLFPKFIYKLDSLEKLKVKNTKIEVIESCNVNFNKLKSIDLNSNKLNSLPKWLYTLLDIEELSAAGNSILSISEDISNLKRLKRINLDKNNLTDIPQGLQQLVNLNHLSLDQNNFSEEVKNQLFLNYKIWFN